MELIWSTATFSPSNSKTWSASVVWFSNAMWYWKPEQPPPTTATRSATGTGLCMLMISLTLVLATGVKLIINPLGLRSRARPRSYLPLQYNRTRKRRCKPLFLSRNATYHRISTSRGASLTIGCDDQAQSYSHSRRRNRPGSRRGHASHFGSDGRQVRVGRDRRTLRQLLRPGKKRQPGGCGSRAQESRCPEGPHGDSHCRGRAERKRCVA